MKNWKNRYFRLKGNRVYYFENHSVRPSAASIRARRLTVLCVGAQGQGRHRPGGTLEDRHWRNGSLRLEFSHASLICDHQDGRKYCFVVSLPSDKKKQFILDAPSPQVRDEWIEAFRIAMASTRSCLASVLAVFLCPLTSAPRQAPLRCRSLLPRAPRCFAPAMLRSRPLPLPLHHQTQTTPRDVVCASSRNPPQYVNTI